MTPSQMKWKDYRAILRVLYSACCSCDRPCVACQDWARAMAFGRKPTGDYADACANTYRRVKVSNG
jgi:hypothetical protein